MILTNCAACAAPLAHDHKKRCSRCKTRYCNEASAGNAAARDVHGKAGFVLALCDAFRRVDESRE